LADGKDSQRVKPAPNSLKTFLLELVDKENEGSKQLTEVSIENGH